MKTIGLFLLFFPLAASMGASVLWNDGFALRKGGFFSPSAWRLAWTSPESLGVLADSLYPCIEMETATAGGTARVSAVEETTVGYAYQWVEIHEGETVSAATTRGLDGYFQKGWIDWSEGDPTSGIGKSDYPILVANDGVTPFYLGFAAELTQAGEHSVVYGWIQLFADGADLKLGTTAIDLSGNSIVVGQVPEPSAAALAIIGMALMAKRRGKAARGNLQAKW